MTIRNNIGFSLLFHSLLLLVTALSARHIMSGERIFFVELKDGQGAGKLMHEGNSPEKVHETSIGRIVRKNDRIVPSGDEEAERAGKMKRSTPEDLYPGTAESRLSPEKAEDASGSLQEKSGYGSGEANPAPGAASSGEHAAGTAAGVNMIEIQSGGGGGGGSGQMTIVGQIKSSIERAKIYPSLARKRKQEGTVIAEFSINAKGLPQNIQIIKSSGFSLLDTATRDTILRASPFPLIGGIIEVPLTFILKTD